MNMRRIGTLFVCALIALSATGAAELVVCACGGGGGSSDDGPTTYPLNLTIATQSESTAVKVQTDVNPSGTEAYSSGSNDEDTIVDTVENLLEAELDLLYLHVYVDGTEEATLDVTAGAAYRVNGTTVVATDATSANDCNATTSWVSVYSNYDEEADDPRLNATLDVVAGYKVIYENGDPDFGNKSGGMVEDNPLVHNGTHEWPFESGSNIEHYEVRYKVYLDGNLTEKTDWLQVDNDIYDCPT